MDVDVLLLILNLGDPMMRQLLFFVVFTSVILFTPDVNAESHNLADYPLRIHIYRRSETTFHHNRQTEEAKGEGRANLFEGGEPKGVAFKVECDTKTSAHKHLNFQEEYVIPIMQRSMKPLRDWSCADDHQQGTRGVRGVSGPEFRDRRNNFQMKVLFGGSYEIKIV
jgi:hypothetical protein